MTKASAAGMPITVAFPALLQYNIGMKNDAVKTEDSVTITRSEYESFLALKRTNAYLESANRWLEEQLKVLKDKMYGKRIFLCLILNGTMTV